MKDLAYDIAEFIIKGILSLSVFVVSLAGLWKVALKHLAIKLRDRINEPITVALEEVKTQFNEIKELLKNVDEKVEEVAKAQQFLNIAQKFNMETSDLLWWRSNSKGETVEVSPQLCRYMKLHESQLSKFNWMNRIPVEQRADITLAYNLALDGSRDFIAEYDFEKGDGLYERFSVKAQKGGEEWFGVVTPLKNKK